MTNALVIGGGLAGASLALQLKAAGRDVSLIEKESRAHHKMCGEFLSREAILLLRDLGIDPVELGSAAITSVRLATRVVIAEAKLGFRAQSLSRKCLDETLLERAIACGVEVIRGERAESLERVPAGWSTRLQEGRVVTGRQAFLATGKHDLRNWPRPAGRHNDLVAFKMYWQLAARQREELSGAVELILFPGGYCGLQLVEEGAANLCLLIERAALRRLGGKWSNVLDVLQAASPHAAARLAGAQALLEAPLALSAIPYGYVRRSSDGPWRLGDQAAVIPSFAGNGMSIALASAQLAARMFLSGASTAAYYQRLNTYVRRPLSLATVISKALVYPHWRRPIELLAGSIPSLLRHVAAATRLARADADFC